MMRRLLLDAGNSSLKWAVVEAGKWRAQGRCDYAELADLGPHLTHDTACFVASVTRPAHASALAAWLQAAGIEPAWLRAEAAFAGLRNGYHNPQQLGVDRWMGLIAAWQRAREAVLVVSAGTAMTIDAVSAEGEFLGGLIVPGAALMRQALLQGTAGVGEIAGHCQAFPRDTADAVESGIVAALCGAVRQQHGLLAERVDKPPRVLLTGGDAGLLLPHLGLPLEHVPALVLEGIDCVARERTS